VKPWLVQWLNGGEVSAILLVVAALWALHWLCRARIAAGEREEFMAGYNLGYFRGRRDERQVQAGDPSSLDGEPHPPLIVETPGDGVQRRFDQ
jgi:hypothetical protein